MKFKWIALGVAVNVVGFTLADLIENKKAPPLNVLINDQANTYEPHEVCPEDKLKIIKELERNEGFDKTRYLI